MATKSKKQRFTFSKPRRSLHWSAGKDYRLEFRSRPKGYSFEDGEGNQLRIVEMTRPRGGFRYRTRVITGGRVFGEYAFMLHNPPTFQESNPDVTLNFCVRSGQDLPGR